MDMDLEILYENIKKLCKEKKMNISQLEKTLQFSAGSLGKWRHSFPGIDKVWIIADFFGVSMEELCGTEKIETEKNFMGCLIKKTIEYEIEWIPCTLAEINQLRYIPLEKSDQIIEMYEMQFENGKVYIALNNIRQKILYISLENDICFRQKENEELVEDLWKEIKENEEKLIDKINIFKNSFIYS